MGEGQKSSKAADPEEFHGKRILVTGGTRGIGAAIVDSGKFLPMTFSFCLEAGRLTVTACLVQEEKMAEFQNLETAARSSPLNAGYRK
jgi:NAD(P)-dependent dehydrogenase (short-subunit alcohol dehydrogenase family)